MKRWSTELNNLESRMRKKAALDLKERQEREIEEERIKRNKMSFDSRGRPLYTMDSLPPYMFHLGGDKFVIISFFQTQTRVHVRKFYTDEDGFLHPTKDGVSVLPNVWLSFEKKFAPVQFSDDEFLILNKDLCVSSHTKDGETVYVFQKLFMRKNLVLEFKPESVILTFSQTQRLVDLLPDISGKVKEDLIRFRLRHCVQLECENSIEVLNEYNSQTFRDCIDLSEMTDSLSKCIMNSLSTKIVELFPCFPCIWDWPLCDMHKCVTTSRAQKYENFFEQAFCDLNWCEIAKNFLELNIEKFEEISVDDFFTYLNTDILFKNIEKLYTAEEEENFV